MMKIKPDYIMRSVAGNHVVVPTSEAVLDFSGMMTLNETGAFLWELLVAGKTEQGLLLALLEEYEIDEFTAKADILEFLAKLKAADVFE